MTKSTPKSVPAGGRLASAGSTGGRITELYTLGGVRVLCEGSDETSKLGPRHVALLVFLYHEARPLQPSELVELLGRGQEEDKELERLHKAINWLRNNITGVDISFNGDTIETYGGVRLDTREVDAAIDGRDPEHVAALYTGEFLEGFESGAPAFDEWAQRERARLQRAWGNAILARAREADRKRDWQTAAHWWKVLVNNSPTRADAVAGLLSAFAQAARWAEATEAFEKYSELLKKDGTSKIPQPVGRVIAAHPRLKDHATGRLPMEKTASGSGETTPSGATPGPRTPSALTPPAEQPERVHTPKPTPDRDEPTAEPDVGSLGSLDDAELLPETAGKSHGANGNNEPVASVGDHVDEAEAGEREPWKEFLELPEAGGPKLAPPFGAARGPRQGDDDDHPFGRPGGRQSDAWGEVDPLEEARAAARSYVNLSAGGSTRIKHEITSVRKPWGPALENTWHELRPWLELAGAKAVKGFIASVRFVLKLPALAGLALMVALGWVGRTSSAIGSTISSMIGSILERRRDAKRRRTAERARKAAEAQTAAARKAESMAVERAVRESQHARPVTTAASSVRDDSPTRERAEGRSPAGDRDPVAEAKATSESDVVPELETSPELDKSPEPGPAGELDLAEELEVEESQGVDGVPGVHEPSGLEDVAASESATSLAVPGLEEFERVEESATVETESLEDTSPTPVIVSRTSATRHGAAGALARTGASLQKLRTGVDWSGAIGTARRFWFAPVGVAVLLLGVLLGPGIVARIGGLSENLRADLPEVHAPVPRVILPKVVVPKLSVRTPAFVETSVSKIGAVLSGAILTSSGQWLLVADVQLHAPLDPASVAEAAVSPVGNPAERPGTTAGLKERTPPSPEADRGPSIGRRRSPSEVLQEDREWSSSLAALTTALETDIKQARYYNVVPHERALTALAAAGLAAGQRLPVDRALSLARLESYGAVVVAHIRPRSAGADSVEIQVLSPAGDTLYGVATGIGDDVTALEALSGLSRAVRRRLGEPATDVEASPPSTQLLTASVPALEAYAEARMHLYANRYSQAVAAARLAIARDSTFAMAYRILAETYALQGLRPRARNALETAWELSGRLDERERYRLLADRLAWDRQYSDAALTYDELFKRYRDDAAALRCLALVQRTIGVRGGGEGNLGVAYAIDPYDWPSLSHLARYLGYSGPLPDVDSLTASMDTVPLATE